MNIPQIFGMAGKLLTVFFLLGWPGSLLWGADTGVQQWANQLGGDILSVSLSPAGDTIYAGAKDKKVYALNDDGTQKWTYATNGKIYSTPGVAGDGTLYFGSDDSNVYALNADGTLKWQYQTGGEVRSSTAIADDGTVYIGSNDTYFYALNTDGTLKWQYQTGGPIDAGSAIDTDGTIYLGSNDNTLYALNADGTLKWSYATSGAIVSSPAVDTTAKVVYAGSGDAYVYALNTDDGSLKWQYQTGGAVATSPAVAANGTVYIGSDDTYVYAINPDGSLKWKYQTGGPVDVDVEVSAGGTVLAAPSSQTLSALDSSSGTLSWSFQTYNNLSTNLVMDGSLVYFGALDEIVYAVAAPVSASTSVTQVTLVSPADNTVLDYAATQGQLTFSFWDVTDAESYTLHLMAFDVLSGMAVPVEIPLVPGLTSGLSQAWSQWNYDLILNHAQWEALAAYHFTWGIDALDGAGQIISSSQSTGGQGVYANALKLVASFAIHLTTPSFGAALDLAGPAPDFSWDAYTGVDTYTLVMGHMENSAFDNILIKDNLTQNSHTMSDSQWESLPAGTWYWTVWGTNSLGSLTPPELNIMEFTLSGQPSSGTVFSVSQSSITLKIGETQDIVISNGSGYYNVDISDATLASAVIYGDFVTVTGLASGTTDVVISDSTGNVATVSITVN